MPSLRTTFAKAAFGTPGSGTFWLLIWAIFILDDAERREKEAREKRKRPPQPRPPKPHGPRP